MKLPFFPTPRQARLAPPAPTPPSAEEAWRLFNLDHECMCYDLGQSLRERDEARERAWEEARAEARHENLAPYDSLVEAERLDSYERGEIVWERLPRQEQAELLRARATETDTRASAAEARAEAVTEQVGFEAWRAAWERESALYLRSLSALLREEAEALEEYTRSR
jgi:hypothetical protein